jgi:hypothetical protein
MGVAPPPELEVRPLAEARADDALIFDVLGLWDAGRDTYSIAVWLNRKQHIVEAALHAGLRQRRAAKRATPAEVALRDTMAADRFSTGSET